MPIGAITAGALLCAVMAARPAPAGEPVRFGYLERVQVYPGKTEFEAKLDTGADNSSMHAETYLLEKRGTAEWVIFNAVNKAGKSIRFELPVVRTAEVRRHGGTLQNRPVVKMEFCIGKIRREVEVNLVDRSALSYRLLIGRSFLAGRALVDSAKTFTTQPKCR